MPGVDGFTITNYSRARNLFTLLNKLKGHGVIREISKEYVLYVLDQLTDSPFLFSKIAKEIFKNAM